MEFFLNLQKMNPSLFGEKSNVDYLRQFLKFLKGQEAQLKACEHLKKNEFGFTHYDTVEQFYSSLIESIQSQIQQKEKENRITQLEQELIMVQSELNSLKPPCMEPCQPAPAQQQGK